MRANNLHSPSETKKSFLFPIYKLNYNFNGRISKKYPSLATFSMYCLYTDEAYALLIMNKNILYFIRN